MDTGWYNRKNRNNKGPFIRILRPTSRRVVGRRRWGGYRQQGQGRRGQATLEFALGTVLFIFVILAVIQFAIVIFAQIIVTEAAQEGSRQAAATDASLEDGLAAARRNLDSGLGQVKKDVSGSADAARVIVRARVEIRSFLPFLNSFLKFELESKSDMAKEGWRS